MKTLFVGQNLIELDSIGSTNSYANELLREKNLPEGTVIWAKSQTEGRGQRGSKWLSEPYKNMAFSVVLYPVFLSVERQFDLSKVISLATADFVSVMLQNRAQKQKVKIKWPNDIYIGSKKVAGILVENSIKNKQIISSIVGIGVNINQEVFQENIPNPTSFKQVSGVEFDLKRCLEEICSFIEAKYLMLRSETVKLHRSYLQSLYRYEELNYFDVNGVRIRGRIIDVLPDGKLVLETDQVKQSFNFREISFVI